MKLQIFSLACAISGLIGMAAPASAQMNRDPLEMIARADVNSDGDVSWSELMQTRETGFGRLDRNGDGYADKSDRPRAGGRRFDEIMGDFADADANGDGRISRDEFINAPAPGFEAADTNKDKVVTAAEAAALRQSRGR